MKLQNEWLGMILKARHCLNRNFLMSLCYSFIYPCFTYFNYICGDNYSSNLRKLWSVQNKIERIMHGAHPRQTMNPLYAELGFLKLKEIEQYLIARFMFHYNVGRVPVLHIRFFYMKFTRIIQGGVTIFISLVSRHTSENQVSSTKVLWSETCCLNMPLALFRSHIC